MRRKSILNSDFILLHIPTNNTFKKIEKHTDLFLLFFLIVSTYVIHNYIFSYQNNKQCILCLFTLYFVTINLK
jgi:hypothetical protein